MTMRILTPDRLRKLTARRLTQLLWSGPCAFLTITLAGCTVGPAYHRPTAQLQQFHNAPPLDASSAVPSSPPLDVWWTGFNDPELTRIIQRVLAENLDLSASMARVQQSRAAALQAGAQRKPTADLNASSTSLYQSPESELGRAASHLPGYKRGQDYYDLGIGASWETDLFGSLKRGAEAATAEAQAAEAMRTGTRITVAAEAADAYFQVRGAQLRLAFAKEQTATDEHLVQLVQQRRTAGIASDGELAQAQAVLSQARATIQPLNITLEAELNRLDVLMGVQPGTYAAELSSVKDIPAVPGITGPLTPNDLLRRRPDIIAAERRVAASNARIGQALAEYYPKISLSGVLGSESIAPGHLFQSTGFQPIGVAGLRWRLFDFGKVDAEVKQARGTNAEALVQYRNTVLHAAEDVEDSLSALSQTEARQSEVGREIGALQRVRNRSQESYTAGVISLTDVLDADRQLLAAQDDLALTRMNAARAAVGSFRALGGGWTP